MNFNFFRRILMNPDPDIRSAESNPEFLQHSADMTRREFLKKEASNVAAAAATVLALTDQLSADDTPSASMDDNDHHTEAELQKLMNQHWEKQNAMYAKIAEKGVGFQGYYNALLNKEKAFFTPEEIDAGHGKCECCSDEGIRHYDPKKSAHDMMLVRTPGSGILQVLDTDDQDPFADNCIKDTAKEALAAGVTVFTAHAGCGAFKAVYNNWLKKQGMPEASSEELDKRATLWAQLVVAKMRDLVPEKADSITADFIATLERPSSIHIARCLYLTDLDEFNAGFDGLPQGFVERTGRAENLKDILDHADVLRKIAFDPHHGFGTKFTFEKAEQFVMCCVTDTPERLAILITKAEEAVHALDQDVCGKIRVEGLLKNAA